MKLEDVIFPLNRPEYAKIPELFQASLAWGVAKEAGVAHPRVNAEGKKEGLVFQKIQQSKGKTISIEETFPGGREALGQWTDLLTKAGFAPVHGEFDADLAESLMESLEAIKPEKSKASAAMPLVPSSAYLQDPVGLHAKANPPNFYEIIEQVFNLGSPSGYEGPGAAELWYKAVSLPEEQVFFERLSSALSGWTVNTKGLIDALPGENVGRERTHVPPLWLSSKATPFHWFHDAWKAFCSPDWRRALPRRRWSDWASCLLRTGISLGYLWEAWFYQAVGRVLLDPATAAEQAHGLLVNPEPLLEWRDDASGLTSRDVNSRIRRLVADGLACRDILGRLTTDHAESARGDPTGPGRAWHGEDGLAKYVTWLCGVMSDEDRAELQGAFGNKPVGGANNTIETITFSLQTRSELGTEADYYGLLVRRSRRFLLVNPGLEWIVVVASMTAGQPNSETTLGQLKRDLKRMGLGFPRDRLVAELERVGLSRSSHDADDAIVVRTGF